MRVAWLFRSTQQIGVDSMLLVALGSELDREELTVLGDVCRACGGSGWRWVGSGELDSMRVGSLVVLGADVQRVREIADDLVFRMRHTRRRAWGSGDMLATAMLRTRTSGVDPWCWRRFVVEQRCPCDGPTRPHDVQLARLVVELTELPRRACAWIEAGVVADQAMAEGGDRALWWESFAAWCRGLPVKVDALAAALERRTRALKPSQAVRGLSERQLELPAWADGITFDPAARIGTQHDDRADALAVAMALAQPAPERSIAERFLNPPYSRRVVTQPTTFEFIMDMVSDYPLGRLTDREILAMRLPQSSLVAAALAVPGVVESELEGEAHVDGPMVVRVVGEAQHEDVVAAVRAAAPAGIAVRVEFGEPEGDPRPGVA